MKKHIFVEKNTSYIIMFALTMPIIFMIIKNGIDVILVSIILIDLFIIFVLYKICVIIEDNAIIVKLGIGIFGKTYKFSDISSCEIVKEDSFKFSLSLFFNTTSYNYNKENKVVELRFKNSKKIVRIGMAENKITQIHQIISPLLNNNAPAEKFVVSKKPISPLWAVFIGLLIIVVPLWYSTSEDIDVTVGQNQLIIHGSYGQTIPFENIIKTDTVSNLPDISFRGNGLSIGETSIGYFKLTDGSKIKLFMKSWSPPYLLILSKNNEPIYITFKDKNKTIELYNKIKK